MVRLWYSNHLEKLVDSLVEKIRAERAESDPFAPVRIVVPNRNLATYLKFQIARRTGILANVQFEYLYSFFRDLLPDDADVELIDRRRMHAILVSAFDDPALRDNPELQPVFDYIDASPDEDGRQRRAYQLAHQVGRVFEEYTLSRTRMLQLWSSDHLFDDEPWASAEAWQRALWLEVFGPDGRLERIGDELGVAFHPLGELVQAVPVNELDLPESAHIFGLSYVARVFYGLFYRVSSLCELNIYTLNPCMEYWEDVPTGWRVPQRDNFLRRHAEHASLAFTGEADLWEYEDDVAPLRLWGRPGRDNVRLLNILTNCDFEARFVDPMGGGDTLLHRIQRDILTRHPARTTPEFAYRDDSIQLLECPTIQREVETIANAIWELKEEALERGETLRFNDIAVIVSARQRDAYQARIRSVFQNTHDIPHNIVDITAASHRRFLEAVHLLLSLPFGDFGRNELLKLLTHPNVLAHADEADRATWQRWIDELNVLYGADRGDLEDTYVKEDLFTWDQGMRRLTLGAFMASDLAGETRLWQAPNGFAYVPHEIGQQESDSAGQLVNLARGLVRDARRLIEGTRPLAEWMDIASRLVNAYLEPDSDDDTYERMRVLEELKSLGELDLTGDPISYRVAWEFIAERLGSLEISRGQYLAEGVVVSSFLPMRPIPFKVVFVTGLGEKYFPRSETRSPLDLRWAKREIGDVFSTREQDEYMFLETLISTREKFVLSYVSRDAQTGERLEPSPVVRELLFMIERGYTDAEGRDALVRTMPLRRWSAPQQPEELLPPEPVEPPEPVGAPGAVEIDEPEEAVHDAEASGRFDDDDDIAPWEVEDFGEPDDPPTVAPVERAAETADALATDLVADELSGPLPIGSRAFQPEAQAEARALALRRSLEAQLSGSQIPSRSWSDVETNLSPEARRLLRRQLGIHARPDTEPGPGQRVEITLNQMLNFLRSPLQGSAKFFLGMREETFEDPIEYEDEELETGRPLLFLMLRDVFMKHLASAHAEPRSIRDIYDEETRRLELKGDVPTGLFRDAEREKHLNLLNRWRTNLGELQVDTSRPLRAVTFGGRTVPDVEAVRAPAIDLTVPVADADVSVRLTGQTSPFDANSTSLLLVTSKLESVTDNDKARFFRGFLDMVWLIASGAGDPAIWRVALDPTGQAKQQHRRGFRTPGASEARAYLIDVASDMLSGAHSYRMPMEAVFKYKANEWLEFHKWLAQIERSKRGRYASHWGPIRNPDTYPAPVNSEELIARRFGLYFELLQGGER